MPAARRCRAPINPTSRHRLDTLERQNPHSLASVYRALVRFGLNHKLVAVNGVKADLISPKSAPVPFDIDMINDLSRRQLVRATICQHCLVQFDALLIGRLGAWTWLLVRDEKHNHPPVGSVADISIGMLSHLIVMLTSFRDLADER